MQFSQIEAIIFDFDGTLVDSESATDIAVAALLKQRALPDEELDYSQFHGITWRQITRLLGSDYPELQGEQIAGTLHRLFHAHLLEQPPPLVNGAREAVIAASQVMPAAVASSSNRESVEHVLHELNLLTHFSITVCAEDYRRSKPDPQSFLLAAERLERAPEHCLVFEDNLAGLTAARAAGMGSVAITWAMQDETLREARELADLGIADFTELSPKFFTVIGAKA